MKIKNLNNPDIYIADLEYENDSYVSDKLYERYIFESKSELDKFIDKKKKKQGLYKSEYSILMCRYSLKNVKIHKVNLVDSLKSEIIY